jgi:hypothetical protein
MAKKLFKENVSAPAGQPAQPSSPAVQKLEKKFSNIKDLDQILSGIKVKGDAAAVLALIAAKLGGTNLKGSEILKKATAEALESEQVNESFNSVNEFVSYLFE